jgi:hypothetical protein
MMKKTWMGIALVAGLFAVVGCGQKPADTVSSDKKTKEVAKAGPNNVDGHGEWCDEHGVAEDGCSMCQKDVFKKLKPDEICPKHPDRAKAQCFICTPDLWEKSKAGYVAKYGKEPPMPEANMPAKK